MIKVIRLTYLLTAFMLFAAGCTEYESIEDFPIAEPAIVANSLFQADSAITVYVSRSLSILDNAEIKPITDAMVVVYKDGLAVDTMRESNESQAYVSAIFPETGHQYSVRVSRSGYNTVTSSSESLPTALSIGKITAVPVDSTMTELWYQHNLHDDSAFTSYSMDVAITIDDPVNEHNIYSVMVLKEDSSIFLSDYNYLTTSVCFTSSDMSLLDNANLENSGSYRTIAYFDDRNFDGRQYQFKLRIEDNEWTTFAAKYIVLVRSLTETSYKYFKSLNSNYNETSPFDEPARVFTNIHNGFGIFAGYERKSYRIR